MVCEEDTVGLHDAIEDILEQLLSSGRTYFMLKEGGVIKQERNCLPFIVSTCCSILKRKTASWLKFSVAVGRACVWRLATLKD